MMGYIYILKMTVFSAAWGMCFTYTSYPNFKFDYPNHLIKLFQILTQFPFFTQNDFDTHFDKTLIFPSKTKFSDNLFSIKIT